MMFFVIYSCGNLPKLVITVIMHWSSVCQIYTEANFDSEIKKQKMLPCKTRCSSMLMMPTSVLAYPQMSLPHVAFAASSNCVVIVRVVGAMTKRKRKMGMSP